MNRGALLLIGFLCTCVPAPIPHDMSSISGVIKAIRNHMRNDTGVNGDAQRLEQLGWMLFLKVFDDKEQELELDDAYDSPLPPRLKWRHWAGDDEGMTGDTLLAFVNKELFPTLAGLPPVAGDRRRTVIRNIFAGNYNYMKSGTIMKKVINEINKIDFNRAKDKQVFGRIYEDMLRELQSAGKAGEFYTPRGVTEFMVDVVAPELSETVLDPACGTGGFLTAAAERMRAQTSNVDDYYQLQENLHGMEVKPLPYQLCVTNLILHDIEQPNITFDSTLARELTAIRKRDRVDVIFANPPFGGVVGEGEENNVPSKYRSRETADLFLLYIMRYLKDDGGRAAIVLPDGSLTGDGVKQKLRQKWLTDCNLHTIVRLPNSVFKPYAQVSTNLLFFTKGEPTEGIWYYEHRLPEGQKSYSKTKPIRRAEFDPILEWWDEPVETEQSWYVPITEIERRGYDLDVKNPNTPEEDHGDPVKLLAAYHQQTETLRTLQDELLRELSAALTD